MEEVFQRIRRFDSTLLARSLFASIVLDGSRQRGREKSWTLPGMGGRERKNERSGKEGGKRERHFIGMVVERKYTVSIGGVFGLV